jgi:hypothetical protein
MTLRKITNILVVISCISLLLVCVTIYYMTPKKLDTTQDEKEWANDLQKERDRRSIESGREAFERLDRIYGEPNSKF